MLALRIFVLRAFSYFPRRFYLTFVKNCDTIYMSKKNLGKFERISYNRRRNNKIKVCSKKFLN